MLFSKDTEKELYRNKVKFEEYLHEIEACNNLDKKQILAKKAIKFATNSSTGYFSSNTIEDVFLRLARENSSLTLSETYVHNSTLHVMTECYAVGGHTRVVERWVETSNENEVHSVLFTSNQDQVVPDALTSSVLSRRGEIYKLKNSLSDIDKGMELREIASRYKRVVLHVHMHDVIPLIAFGTAAFKRPVILYNHADHLFWVGVSIADYIAETRSWGRELTLAKRGAINSFVLSIPTNPELEVPESKSDLRKQLNLPLDKKIVFSVGSPHKYEALGDLNFILAIETILISEPQAIFVCVGPTLDDLPEWKRKAQLYKGRIVALGSKLPSELYKYIKASDLVLDSFPMSGGTALGDATTVGAPVLALKCTTGHLDYTLETSAYCTTPDELTIKALKLLKEPKEALSNLVDVKSKLDEFDSIDVWKKRVNELYCLTDVEHNVLQFNTLKPINFNELDHFILSFSKKKKLIFKLSSMMRVYHFRVNGMHHFSFNILGLGFTF